MTDKLNFLVKKDLWLAAEPEPKFKIVGWTIASLLNSNNPDSFIIAKDLYIVMGKRENHQSQRNIVTGEKISLNHLLDVYSTAVGQKLILK